MEGKQKHPGGRPSKYTPELVEEICEAIACDSKGLRRLCAEHPTWPDRMNIYKWLRKHPEFRILYTQAKESQIEAIVDDILDISDDVSHDTVIKVDSDGNEKEVYNAEYVNRSRLRIDTRKWLAAKLCPRIYGQMKPFVSEEDDTLISQVVDKL